MSEPWREHIEVPLREHFCKFIAANIPPTRMLKKEGEDKLVVDYFDPNLSPQEQDEQTAQCAKSLSRANFPGSVTLLFQHGMQPMLQFEGREAIEMLVQYGVKFRGWEAYKKETVIEQDRTPNL